MSVHRLSRDKKRWYFQFYYDGKKIKKEIWNKQPMLSKNEALQCELDCKNQLENEKKKKLGYITFHELYDEFVKNSKLSLKATSLRVYGIFKRNYLNVIPNKIIYDLIPNDFLIFKNYVNDTKNTIEFKNRIINIMRSVLQYANLMYELSGKLQIPLIEPLKENKIKDANDKTKYLPIEEFEMMLTYLDLNIESDYYYFVIFKILYYTGLRIGELAALTIDDYTNGYLNINKDYARIGSCDIIQSPKNSNSIRKVLLDGNTKKLLDEYILKFKPNHNLFSRNKKYLSQQRVRDVLRRIAKASGLDLKYDISPHTLRHSHASNLRSLGFDAFAIAKRLGNTPDVSASTYIHSSNDEQQKIVEKLENSTKIER